MAHSKKRSGVGLNHIAILASLCLATPLALAQGRWSARVIELSNPASLAATSGNSRAIIHDILVNGVAHAAYWSTEDGQWHDINPPGAQSSRLTCVGLHRFGGNAIFNGVVHAGVWDRDTLVWTDLHPTDYVSSSITDIDDSVSPYVYSANSTYGVHNHAHAMVYRASTGTWLDLSMPYDAAQTYVGEWATAVSQTSVAQKFGSPTQGGRFYYATSLANVMTGSGTRLEPYISDGSLSVYDISGNLAVGAYQTYINFPVYQPVYAYAWNGLTPIDITPHSLGLHSGSAGATRNGKIVGWARVDATPTKAIFWNSVSASAATDLSTVLPSDATSSSASAVWRQGSVDLVVGNATIGSVNRIVLWSRTTCIADVANTFGVGVPDGAVTVDDLLVYLADFEDGIFTADLDNGTGTATRDGAVTIDDLLFFLAHFEAGC